MKLQGIFFNKAEMEAVTPLKNALLRTFSVLLSPNYYNNNNQLDGSIILKMVAMLIFTVHNVVLPRNLSDQPPLSPHAHSTSHNSPSPSPTKSLYSHPSSPRSSLAPADDVAQTQVLAVNIAFEFITSIARATCSVVKRNTNNSNSNLHELFDAEKCGELLGSVGVFLEWLRMHPEFIPRNPSSGSLWDTLAQLLNFLSGILISVIYLFCLFTPCFISFLFFFYAQ